MVWENVKGAIYTGGLAEVLRGLSRIGYLFDVEVISAAEVGAPHLRERVFVVAYAYELFGKTPPWSNQVGSEIKATTATQGGDFPKRVKAYLPTGQVLNPQFVEWLMGYPTDWTDLRC